MAIVDPTAKQRVQFTPVQRRTVASEIRERLLEKLRSGELRPGQQLPSERALCEDFDVARTSVREAIQSLVSMGYVERRGNRTHVAERMPTFDLASDLRKEHVRELFETRRLLEIPMAELACCRATPAEREAIAELAAQFTARLPIEAFRRLDRRFHTAIAAACGNNLLAELYGKVLDALFTSTSFEELLYATRNRREVRLLVDQSGEAHRRIGEAIVRGDAVAISGAAADHLAEVEQRMVERLS